MAIYEYQCPHGHTSTLMVRLEARPATVDCPECGRLAEFIVSAVPTTFRLHDRKAFKQRGVK